MSNLHRLRRGRSVILGVAASDSHAVANRLIAWLLQRQGFRVVNLGVCTPVSEFCAAFQAHPNVEAIIIGSLNGHAYEDLRALKDARAFGHITCPVIVGGNLSVGCHKQTSDHERLFDIGVDHILDDPYEIAPFLDRLRAEQPVRQAG